MNKILLRGWNWCRRFRNRCGYGVHSPSDFFLITFVIYEKLPFYAYSPLHHLRRLVSHLPGHREKVDKLLFRLVNYLQPKFLLEFGTGSGMSTRYMCEANPGMEIYTLTDKRNSQVERIFSCKNNIHYIENSSCFFNDDSFVDAIPPVMFHIAHTSDYKKVYEDILEKVSDDSCLVISYPYMDSEKKKWWKEVINDVRTGVTFDLYDIGIVFFDKKRIKEHRVVNFL